MIFFLYTYIFKFLFIFCLKYLILNWKSKPTYHVDFIQTILIRYDGSITLKKKTKNFASKYLNQLLKMW